jgi:hypothetical protein
LLVSQIQAISLISDLSESLNESSYYFVIPLFEFGHINDLHLVDVREEVIMELLFQIEPLDDGVSRQ